METLVKGLSSELKNQAMTYADDSGTIKVKFEHILRSTLLYVKVVNIFRTPVTQCRTIPINAMIVAIALVITGVSLYIEENTSVIDSESNAAIVKWSSP
jgi:hypothetical protein